MPKNKKKNQKDTKDPVKLKVHNLIFVNKLIHNRDIGTWKQSFRKQKL